MLQEWLEELAEDEMKKTASSQFEEVLQQMDIPELVAFYEMNNDLEKQAGVLDRTAAGVIGAGGGAFSGGLAGGVLGGAGGALAADPGQRGEGFWQGARRGVRTGVPAGAIGGGVGGLATGSALGGSAIGEIAGGLSGAYAGYTPEEAAALEEAAKAKVLEQKAAAEAAMQKGAELKIKQAMEAGKTLARLGFVPEGIKTASIASKAKDLYSGAARAIGKHVGEGKKVTQHAKTLATDVAGTRGGREAADFAAEQAGEAAEETGKKVLKGIGGAAGGATALTAGGLTIKKMRDKKKDDMDKAAAAPVYTEGDGGPMQDRRIRDMLLRVSGRVGPQMALDPEQRQAQFMEATKHDPAIETGMSALGGGAIGALAGGASKGVPGAILGGLGGAGLAGGAQYGLSTLARRVNKDAVGREAEKDLAKYEKAKALEESAAAQQMPKAASFRDTILKVAEKGALPQNHGWEL